MKKRLEVALLAIFLLAFELFIYSLAKMQRAEAGSLSSFIAYSFRWLMSLTGAVAVGLPTGEFVAKKSGKENSGVIISVALVTLWMIAFTAISFVKARSQVTPAQAGGQQPKASLEVSQMVEFVDSEVKEVDPETIEMDLRFRNKSAEDITELDYVFVAVEDVHIFYKIKIREAVYFPGKGTGSVKLTWARSKLKQPELFDTLKRALTHKTLHVFAKPARITLVSGSVIGD